jgi:hypothetical protein
MRRRDGYLMPSVLPLAVAVAAQWPLNNRLAVAGPPHDLIARKNLDVLAAVDAGA